MGRFPQPEGEELRRAVRWIGDQRRERPDVPMGKLIDEASYRFDLSPLEQEMLLRSLEGERPREG